MNDTNLRVILDKKNSGLYEKDIMFAERIQRVIDFAFKAVSCQASSLTIVRKERMLGRLARLIKENMLGSGVEFLEKRANDPDYNVFYNAPVLILFFADEKDIPIKNSYIAVAEKILEYSKSMNLNACWSEVTSTLFVPEQGGELKNQLGIPHKYNLVCSVVLGYIN